MTPAASPLLPAIGAAWLAFMAGVLIGGEVRDAGSFAAGGAIGAGLVVTGFVAASRCRTLSPRLPSQWMVLVPLSLVVGAAMGAGNLAANWAIAESSPALRALLARRMATLPPVQAIVAAPLVEEITVRLFLMSVLAWTAWRLTKRASLAFGIALAGSSLVFALLHLGRPLPADPALANYYRAALVAKYTLTGLPLGWIFWRWGLPYAILCHSAANAAHLVLQPGVF